MIEENKNPGLLNELSEATSGVFEFPFEVEKSFIPLTLTQLMESKPEPIEYAMFPWLPLQGIAFIYAGTGVGKTLFTLNVAFAISSGGSFLKYKSPKPRKVLYVDGEMAYQQIHSRLMQIVSFSDKTYFPENFLLLTPDKILPHRIPQIDTAEGQEIYKKLIELYGIEVIIFDNLSMLTSIDENKSNEWKIVQDWVLYLRSIGKTVLIVHHSGKEKTGYRGTSKMLDCADSAISLQAIVDDGVQDEDVHQIECKKLKIVYHKARLFSGEDAAPYEAQLMHGRWSYRSIELSTMDKIVANLSAGMSQREIAKELLISQTTVNRLTKKARILGLAKY